MCCCEVVCVFLSMLVRGYIQMLCVYDPQAGRREGSDDQIERSKKPKFNNIFYNSIDIVKLESENVLMF